MQWWYVLPFIRGLWYLGSIVTWSCIPWRWLEEHLLRVLSKLKPAPRANLGWISGHGAMFRPRAMVITNYMSRGHGWKRAMMQLGEVWTSKFSQISPVASSLFGERRSRQCSSPQVEVVMVTSALSRSCHYVQRADLAQALTTAIGGCVTRCPLGWFAGRWQGLCPDNSKKASPNSIKRIDWEPTGAQRICVLIRKDLAFETFVHFIPILQKSIQVEYSK